jgi:hypothetical protein
MAKVAKLGAPFVTGKRSNQLSYFLDRFHNRNLASHPQMKALLVIERLVDAGVLLDCLHVEWAMYSFKFPNELDCFL